MANEIEPAKQHNVVSFGETGVKLSSLEEAYRFATAVKVSNLAPKAYMTNEAVLVVMQTGMELGYTPMQAIRNMWPGPDGRPNEYVEASWARVLASGLVEDWSQEATETTATFRVKRKGIKTEVVSTYTIDQARRAGLIKDGGNYQKHPERMLLARAKGFAIKDAFSDVLKGMSIAEVRDEFYAGAAGKKEKDITPTEPDPLFDILNGNGAKEGAPVDVEAPPPTLRDNNGEVFSIDRVGLERWQASWTTAFRDPKNNPSKLMEQFVPALSDAAVLFDGHPQMVKHIEKFGDWARQLAEQAKQVEGEEQKELL